MADDWKNHGNKICDGPHHHLCLKFLNFVCAVCWGMSCEFKIKSLPLSHIFKPLTPKFSLVILFTVCQVILTMLVWRIWYWINSLFPYWYISLFTSPVCLILSCYCREKFSDYLEEFKVQTLQVCSLKRILFKVPFWSENWELFILCCQQAHNFLLLFLRIKIYSQFFDKRKTLT